MTTLADITPCQRAQCVGMWADIDTARYRAVITRITLTYGETFGHALLFAPELGDFYTATLADVTPRYDLPRAWTPDGTPAPGRWETPEFVNDDRGDGQVEYALAPCRRWVGEWEQA